MRTHHRENRGIVASTFLFLVFISYSAHAQDASRYENLQVLSPETTQEELGNAMIANTVGLGLPRRQREGCLYCHVGSMDLPVTEWDFAADDKPEKHTARAMMRMVRDINERHLSGIESRIDSGFEVTCMTCHAGRTDPRPLLVVVADEWETNGVDAAIGKFRDLYERYYGAGAYDFRPGTLIRLAVDVSRQGAWEDALSFMRLNEEIHAESPVASRARFTMQIEQRLDASGITTALAYFEQAQAEQAAGVVDPSILDGVGWRLHRRDRIEEALTVFRRNLEQFPDQYVPNESLADALWFSGSRIEGMAVLDDWVSANPDHDMGRRRLLNMRDELETGNP